MGPAQQIHTKPGLTDTAADSKGQLALQQQLVELQAPPLVMARGGELSVQALGADPDAHRGKLKGVLQNAVPHQQVAVEAPVVIVGCPAIVGFAGFQRRTDTHKEGEGVVLDPQPFPLLGGLVRPLFLQLQGGDEGDGIVHPGQLVEGGVGGAKGSLGLPKGLGNGLHSGFQVVRRAVPGGQNLLPIPLVYVDRVEVVQLLVPADGVHVGVKPLSHREMVAVEGHALPLGQGVDHLGVLLGKGYVKGHRPFHAVEVVVEAGLGLHKEGGGYSAEVQRPGESVLKDPLQKTDGLLGVIEVEGGGVALGNDGLGHGDQLLRLRLLPL